MRTAISLIRVVQYLVPPNLLAVTRAMLLASQLMSLGKASILVCSDKRFLLFGAFTHNPLGTLDHVYEVLPWRS